MNAAAQSAPDPSKPKIALCLSGGGLRATFFHAGVIQLLRDAKLLEKITHIFSVSGGSILAAHVVLNWEKYTGTIEEYAAAESEMFKLGLRDIRGRVIRRWILSWLLMPAQLVSRFRRTNLLEREYAQFFKGTTLQELTSSSGQSRPELHLLATSFTTGQLYSFSRDGLSTGDSGSGRIFRTGIIPLARAVAASSAFPPLFPPLVLTREMLGADVEDLPYDPEYLSDGGVYDNLGFEKFLHLQEDGTLSVEFLFISDAGARFDWDTKRRFWWIVSRTVRATDILMKRVADATLS